MTPKASRLRMPEFRGVAGRPGVPTPTARDAGRPLPGRSSWCSMEKDDTAEGDGAAAPVAVGARMPGKASRHGHIRVAVRVRPLPAGEDGIIEVAGSKAIAIRKDAATGGNEFLRSQQGRVEERVFNQVFGADATQKEVYSWSCAPLVTEAVAKGRSATVFVYGATGAGKTHTMFGAPERDQHGIIFRAIPEVFEAIAAYDGGSCAEGDVEAESLEVKVSFLEIYNEVVRDLLQEGGGNGLCRVLEDERKGVVKVANLVEAPVKNPDEALWHLRAGMQARTVEATAANQQSSRAHAVFTLTIERVRQLAPAQGPFARRACESRQLHSKISLIDLAGSERASFTQNTGSALKDGARINQSLLALANCIDALTASSRRLDNTATPRKKPPYRDSKLTLMLKGSLIGDGLVAMIANVHPGRSHFEDSNNTLEYAKRASTVRPAMRRSSRPGPEEAPAPSMQAAQSSRSTSGDDDQHDGGCAVGTSSSSSLPHSIVEQKRRRAHERNRAKAAALSRTDSQAETMATSTAEECLSEISLSSNGADFDTPSRDLDAEGESSSGSPAPAEWEAEKENAANVTFRGPGRCGSTPAKLPRRGLFEDSKEPKDATPQFLEAEDEPLDQEATSPELETALRLVASLQADKARVEAKLRTVLQERSSLLQDREILEAENMQLRQVIGEKDHQLVSLLSQRR